MNVLIIEDEKPAAEKLEMMILKYDSSIVILNVIQSVQQSIAYLQENQKDIDLIFMDIQLTDGKSFDIFNSVSVQKPIIFTTAFNEFAIEAFKVNSVDYLLKPIRFDDLKKSMQKLSSLKENLPGENAELNVSKIVNAISNIQKSYKNRFMVKIGEHIKSIPIHSILMFYAAGRTVFILCDSGRKFIIDYKLEELTELIDPEIFFRVSRSFIVNLNAINDVIVYSNSRLKIRLCKEFDKEIIVSREKVSDFKIWFSGA